jgi:pimeloyl-ACP methyl ester carboxylesterase
VSADPGRSPRCGPHAEAPISQAADGAPTLVFSHANGFPAGTYGVLFDLWRQAGFRVLAVERFGHDPAYPVTSNWPHLRDQLLDRVRREAPGQSVHLVGHSLGGFLSLMAACWRPTLARSVVLLDSPVIAGWRAQGVRVAKATGLVRRVSPGRVSRTRRHHWPDVDTATRHFANKSVFARWDPRVLDDYVRCGVEPDPAGGVRLAFDRAVETRIYDTLPHHFGTLLKRHPPACPVHFIGGTRSREVRQVGLAMTRAVTQGRMGWIEGDHLFPMEQPEETARTVLEALQSASLAKGSAPAPAAPGG